MTTSLRVAALLVLATPAAFAANGTWANELVTTPLDANWSTAGNWVSGNIAGSTDLVTANNDVATFPSAATVEQPVLDVSYRMLRLLIDNTQADYSLGSSSTSNELVLSGPNSGTPQLLITSGGSTVISPRLRVTSATPSWNTGSTDLTLAGGLTTTLAATTFNLTNTTPVTVQGSISSQAATSLLTAAGTGSLNITGSFNNSAGNLLSLNSDNQYAGTVTLSGTNTFAGAGNWRAGTLALASDGARTGTNTVLGSSGTGTLAAAVVITGSFTYNGAFSQTTGAVNTNITVGGTNTSGTATYSGTLAMGNTARSAGWDLMASAGGTVLFTNVISGAGTLNFLNKVGPGVVRLSAANTFGGGANILNGRLEIANTTGSGLGAGAVAVSGGTAATLGGTGSTSGATTVTNASRLAPSLNTAGANGNFGGVGTLTLGSTSGLTLTSANLDFDLGTSAGSGHDLLNTAGLTLGSSIAFNFTLTGATLELGNPYTLIATSGINTVSGFDPLNITANFVNSSDYTAAFSVDLTSNDLVVTMSAVPEPASALLVVGSLAILAARRRRCP